MTTPEAKTAVAQTVTVKAIEEYINEINQALGCTTGWGVKIGSLLLHAKAELDHGEWMGLFDPPRLKFGLRKAEMLMQIARQKAFCDSKNFSNLPLAWSVLHVLSHLPADALEHGLSTGSIHPELKLSQAREFAAQIVAGQTASAIQSVQKGFEPDRQKARLARYLLGVCSNWPQEYHQQLADLLEQAALKLRSKVNQR
jgi:hypothetical protein